MIAQKPKDTGKTDAARLEDRSIYGIMPARLWKEARKKYGDYLRVMRITQFYDCVPIGLKDLPLFIDWAKSPVFDKLLKGECL